MLLGFRYGNALFYFHSPKNRLAEYILISALISISNHKSVAYWSQLFFT